MKGKKTGGRRPGSVNKTTASVKQALIEAFDLLGGVPFLVKWAKKNPTEFCKLLSKVIPRELEVTAGTITCNVVGIGGEASPEELAP